MRRKIRADTPSLADLHAAIELNPVDRREGSWTKLELIAMNERFATALRRAHPDPREWAEPATRWSRGDRC
jgi:hypothetical protein